MSRSQYFYFDLVGKLILKRNNLDKISKFTPKTVFRKQFSKLTEEFLGIFPSLRL